MIRCNYAEPAWDLIFFNYFRLILSIIIVKRLSKTFLHLSTQKDPLSASSGIFEPSLPYEFLYSEQALDPPSIQFGVGTSEVKLPSRPPLIKA